MTSTKPDVVPKGLYSLADAAKKLGISKTTLYRYARDKIASAIIMKRNNRMYFTGDELIRIWGASY